MHQWTILHMVSINSGNVEISWGGWGKLSKQRVRSSNGAMPSSSDMFCTLDVVLRQHLFHLRS